MKKIIPLCLIALSLAACSSAPKTSEAPATPVATAPTPAPATPAAPSELETIAQQLTQACSSGVSDACKASAQVAAILSGSNAAASSSAPSFNCAKAGTEVEKAICGSKPLSSLDAVMAKVYTSAASSKKTTKADQVNWLNTVRNTCQDVECLAVKYSARILELAR